MGAPHAAVLAKQAEVECESIRARTRLGVDPAQGAGVKARRMTSWGQTSWGQTGVDPKLETLKRGTNCSERRFGWQPGYSVWSFAVPLPSGS
jgi:hypothetical protein